jgi:histone-lysine N-methyltransferase SUV39H
VVQHGRTVAVTIQKTEKKGWGVFAGSKKIPSGTFLGIYSGELLNNEESEERGK